MPSYNDRLFKTRFKKFFHLARFKWLENEMQKHQPKLTQVFELGCFDGRSVEYLPEMPEQYIGYDAGWEDSETLFLEKYSSHHNINFVKSQSVKDLSKIADNKFDLIIALETLEHVPPEQLQNYLSELERILKPGGVIAISVPVEIGPIFVIKMLFKALTTGVEYSYTFREFLGASFGSTKNIRRHEHKGFNYQTFKQNLDSRFSLDTMRGIPFSSLPPLLNTQVGFICYKPKHNLSCL